MSEWAEIYNIRYAVFVKRVLMGWDINKIITTPLMKKYQRFRKKVS